MAENKTFKVEDAQIIFRNFEGREGQYNREGDRNFAVVLDAETAEAMLADGWNIKYLEPREEGDVATPYISVSVKFDVRPPRIVMITATTRTPVTEAMVETLDWADFEIVDLIARGYEWTVNGKSGIKAYLQSLFVTIREDDLERKYGYYAGAAAEEGDIHDA
jgi:hypothetical protein